MHCLLHDEFSVATLQAVAQGRGAQPQQPFCATGCCATYTKTLSTMGALRSSDVAKCSLIACLHLPFLQHRHCPHLQRFLLSEFKHCLCIWGSLCLMLLAATCGMWVTARPSLCVCDCLSECVCMSAGWGVILVDYTPSRAGVTSARIAQTRSGLTCVASVRTEACTSLAASTNSILQVLVGARLPCCLPCGMMQHHSLC